MSGSMSMDILFMAQDVTPSGRTGDAVHVKELVWHLAKRDNRIYLLGRDLQGVSGKEYAEHQKALEILRNNKCIALELIKTRFKLSFSLIKEYHALRIALGVLSKRRIDVIYSRSFDCRLEAFLSKLFDIPLVLEINGLVPKERESISGRKTNAFLKNIRAVFYGKNFKYARKVIAITEGLKNELVDKYGLPPQAITVIHNGVDTESFKPYDKGMAREELNINARDMVVLFVGNLVPWQGLSYLVEAAPMIVRKVPHARFLIVGDGPMRPKWVEECRSKGLADRFIFVGSVAHADVPKYINASDVCTCLFTEIESGESPMKLCEYLACEKPVVGADNTGIESIKAEYVGIWVRPRDPVGIANAIIALLNDERERGVMGRNGRRFVVKNRTWVSISDAVQGICEEAVKRMTYQEPNKE